MRTASARRLDGWRRKCRRGECHRCVERLLALYRAERRDDENARAFFRRVDVPRVKAALHDLEVLDAASAQAVDFVDLGETDSFQPDVQQGECAAP